jgi:hypothetical protein
VTATLVALGVLAIGTYVMKAVGPVASGAGRCRKGSRGSPTWCRRRCWRRSSPHRPSWRHEPGPHARAAGVGVAALAVALRAPFALVVLLGAGVTALVRLAGWG